MELLVVLFGKNVARLEVGDLGLAASNRAGDVRVVLFDGKCEALLAH